MGLVGKIMLQKLDSNLLFVLLCCSLKAGSCWFQQIEPFATLKLVIAHSSVFSC